MMPRIATLTARCAALVLAFPAYAGTLACFGRLSQVQTAASGELSVLLAWCGDWITLCSATTIWKGVPIEVCKRWHAHVLTAKIGITFQDTKGVPN